MQGRESIDLLGLEMDTLWGPDLYGRPAYPPPLVAVAVAVADGARVVRLGADVPSEPLDLGRIGNPGGGCETPPPEIEAYREWVASTGLVDARVSSKPCYVVAEESFAGSTAPTGLEIVAAESTTSSSLIPVRPQEQWSSEAWGELVAGHLGPCAIGLVAGRVVALCHTPVASSCAAEAGSWTHPEARRRGYGAAVTAAWARMAAPLFETLFYSTTAENVASQGIARTLRLRPIGWIWQLRREK